LGSVTYKGFEGIVAESRGVALPMLGYALEAGDSGEGVEAARLLRLAQSGDRGAFEALMRIYEVRVARTALRLLGARQDAQDAAQEVFLRLYRRISQIDSAGSLSGWLYRVTVNVSYDILRRRRSMGAVPLDAARMVVESSAEEDLGREQQRRMVAEALRTLPERERAALALRDIEGLSTREVAAILGSSEATVRSQISTARLKIRKILGRRS
jgi:RNA polymerase sigma-70 factor (ECF subfamily)